MRQLDRKEIAGLATGKWFRPYVLTFDGSHLNFYQIGSGWTGYWAFVGGEDTPWQTELIAGWYIARHRKKIQKKIDTTHFESASPDFRYSLADYKDLARIQKFPYGKQIPYPHMAALYVQNHKYLLPEEEENHDFLASADHYHLLSKDVKKATFDTWLFLGLGFVSCILAFIFLMSVSVFTKSLILANKDPSKITTRTLETSEYQSRHDAPIDKLNAYLGYYRVNIEKLKGDHSFYRTSSLDKKFELMTMERNGFKFDPFASLESDAYYFLKDHRPVFKSLDFYVLVAYKGVALLLGLLWSFCGPYMIYLGWNVESMRMKQELEDAVNKKFQSQ